MLIVEKIVEIRSVLTESLRMTGKNRPRKAAGRGLCMIGTEHVNSFLQKIRAKPDPKISTKMIH